MLICGAITAALAMLLCLSLPLLVFKFDFNKEKRSQSILKFLTVTGLFALCHFFLSVGLAGFYCVFVYFGVAGPGGAAAAAAVAKNFLGPGFYLAIFINVAVTVILLSVLKKTLKLDFRNRALPYIGAILLIAAEGLPIFLIAYDLLPLERSGYIDCSGQFAIKPTLGVSQPFHKGVAKVFPPDSDFKQGSAYFIDKSGKKLDLSAAAYATISDAYKEDVRSSADYQVLRIKDDSGKIPHGRYSEGLAPAAVMLDDNGLQTGIQHRPGRERWGYIGQDGSWVIKPVFAEARPFSEGRAVVAIWEEQPNIWGKVEKGVNAQRFVGFIDKTGKYLVPPVFIEGGSFSEGLAVVTLNVRKNRPGTPRF